MKEILEVIVKNLVDDVDSVSVTEVSGARAVTYEVRVAETDMGKVIGKQGRVAKAIRTLVKSIAIKEHKYINIEFVG